MALVLGAEDGLGEGEGVAEVEAAVHVGVREGYHEGGAGAGEEGEGGGGRGGEVIITCFIGRRARFVLEQGFSFWEACVRVFDLVCCSTYLSSALASKT